MIDDFVRGFVFCLQNRSPHSVRVSHLASLLHSQFYTFVNTFSDMRHSLESKFENVIRQCMLCLKFEAWNACCVDGALKRCLLVKDSFLYYEIKDEVYVSSKSRECSCHKKVLQMLFVLETLMSFTFLQNCARAGMHSIVFTRCLSQGNLQCKGAPPELSTKEAKRSYRPFLNRNLWFSRKLERLVRRS